MWWKLFELLNLRDRPASPTGAAEETPLSRAPSSFKSVVVANQAIMADHSTMVIMESRVGPLRSLAGIALACFLMALGSTGHGGVSIAEFLAVNDGGLKDENVESPDWIELYNSGPGAVDLGGWHLTDDPANLAKWTIPATNLPAGGYLVVFASGKNRAVSGSPLHTNFQLNNSGGYLALVEPDGVTVAHGYDPAYPNQRANVSYGLLTEATSTSLIGLGALARVLVPHDGALGVTWTDRTFDDTSWWPTNTPVAYTVGVTNSTLLALDVNDRSADAAQTTFPGFASLVINSNG
jgi:hypothetical protein